MKTAYFDCFSGISGDMCLGALVDAGASLKQLQRELKKIPVSGYTLTSGKVRRSHFSAVKADVVLTEKNSGKKKIQRRWKDIEDLISRSPLNGSIKKQGLSIFKRLFEAEAKVHGEAFDRVHLHELGAVDCIVDIFGTLIALDLLGIEKIYASPVNIGRGSGSAGSEHGIIPVPSPASVEILKKTPVYSKHIPFELTTPTGAAIIRELSSGFGDLPQMEIEKTGIGAGNMDFKGWPNILRVFIGSESGSPNCDSITVLETNIDDMNPQIYEYVMEKLFRAGAVEVFLTQVIMKKGRPGVKITVLCTNDKLNNLADILFRETTTIGVRHYRAERNTLQRVIKETASGLGRIRVKVSGAKGKVLKTTPEYEDCKNIAQKTGTPLIDIISRRT